MGESILVELKWFETWEQMIVQWFDFRWFSTMLFLVKICCANLNGIVSHCEWLFAACCASFCSAGSVAAENDGGRCLSGHCVLDYLHHRHLLRLPRHCRRRRRCSASAGMKDGAGAIGCHLHSLGYYHHHHRLRHLTAQISVNKREINHTITQQLATTTVIATYRNDL